MRIDPFPTDHITPRPVDIWLPENYSEDKKYAVLYMHDGQMLFDAKTTWNKQEWKVDEWATQLMKEGKAKDFIVVAIHNIADLRWHDLYPQNSFEFMEENTINNLLEEAEKQNMNKPLKGNDYLYFLINDLKPYIDNTFSVYSDKPNTFVAGSSMGGLMSMYAISEYPDVFGGAACLSTHWVGAVPKPEENNPFPKAIFKYMDEYFPESGDQKVYFDYGNKTLDQHYPQYAPRVDQILKAKGYSNKDSRNLFFEGTNHSENAWNKRLDIPLTFLLGR